VFTFKPWTLVRPLLLLDQDNCVEILCLPSVRKAVIINYYRIIDGLEEDLWLEVG
jgi:hypothetical protein